MSESLVFTVSDFVAYLNQTLELAYPYVTIEGELSGFRVSRNRWVYFDLKDEAATVRFFGTVYNLPGPLEDGMVVRVSGNPRLHPQYGFSVTIQSITPVGEGSIRRAIDLLARKLTAEGLFAPERKRKLPYPPRRIALITAAGSAAYADLIKILGVRWRGITVEHFDVQVQGDLAVSQIASAIEAVNVWADLPEVLVLTRGGGSADDLAAFSNERVVRAVAGSRVPTLVAIGHEVDVSLAELAADMRASTPSNAAELLTPDRKVMLSRLNEVRIELGSVLKDMLRQRREWSLRQQAELGRSLDAVFYRTRLELETRRRLLNAYSPMASLERGYAIVRVNHKVIRSIEEVRVGTVVELQLGDGSAHATITGRESMNDKKD